MRKIAIHMETGMVGGDREAVIEVEDGATEEDIDAAVREVVFEWVQWGWSDAPADAEVTH